MSPPENHNDRQGNPDVRQGNPDFKPGNPEIRPKNYEVKLSSPETVKVTRMVILGPSANISQSELVRKLHMMELPLTIKSTCYGAAISGEEEIVKKAISSIRTMDPSNIFTKDRGFPPGDPRRCRAKRGGAREGFHQLEKEFELLDAVSKALENPRKVSLKKPKKVSPEEFKEITEESGK